MKKVVLTIAALVMICRVMGQVKVGAKTGVHYNIWTEKDSDASSGVGFHVGGYAQIPISENMIFQPELMYSARGINETVDASNTYSDPLLGQVTEKENREVTIRVGYLEVPLLLGVAAAEGFNVHVGPVLALRIGYSFEFNYTYTETVGNNTTSSSFSGSGNNDEGVAMLNFGAAVGSSYELESGLSFGLRYIRGFTSIFKDYDYPVNYNGLQFSVGYAIVKD